jgi:signal transduction histidine kinase
MPHTSTVVVVDDNEAGRFAKANILRRAGFNVHEAATGREALAAVAALMPDVVVLDVNLPDISGFEVCRQLKARPSPAQVLQISATAVREQDRIEGLSSGADTYLVEPITPEILIATTRALLRIKRSEQRLAELAEREREARREAEQANRAKDDFLAVLSHELRTPLNAMSGWLWQLKRRPADEALRARAIDGLSRGLRLQARLIDDLLDISRIEKGKIDLSLHTVDLRVAVNDAAESIRQRAGPRQLELQIPDEPVPALVDLERFGQVLGNLLNNAVQYTPEDGRIDVRLWCEHGQAFISVSDSGAGIPSDLLPVIFDAFRQGEAGSTRHTKGLGLGLAIVKRLAVLHGGDVEACSAGRDLGSTFTVRLPLAPADASAAGVQPSGDGALNGTRVLLVEDDPDARDLMRAMLEAAGASVAPCSSAAEALARLDQAPFDALVSDIAMPDTDGLDLMRTMRELGFHLPAVAVTAFSSEGDRDKTSAAGYQAHLSKPIDQQALVGTIAGLIARV